VCYQLSGFWQYANATPHKTMKQQWTNWKIKLCFWREWWSVYTYVMARKSGRGHCQAVKLESNQRVTSDQDPLSLLFTTSNSKESNNLFIGESILNLLNTFIQKRLSLPLAIIQMIFCPVLNTPLLSVNFHGADFHVTLWNGNMQRKLI
jgi:hypothetical protein